MTLIIKYKHYLCLFTVSVSAEEDTLLKTAIYKLIPNIQHLTPPRSAAVGSDVRLGIRRNYSETKASLLPGRCGETSTVRL